MGMEQRSIGGLNCFVADALPAGQDPDVVFVVCHGFGAPGTDLVPLAGELLRLQPGLASRVRFVFPAALLSMDDMGLPGGRAWWPLNVMQMQQAIAAGEFRSLRTSIPPGLTEARAALTEVVRELRQDAGKKGFRLVLGGFSQGAMLSTDVALRLETPPDALVVLSGTMLCETEWNALAASRGNLVVLQSHGRQDPVLPFEAAEWLRDMFTAAGMAVEFLPFEGGHTIPANVLQQTGQLLVQVAES